MMCYYFNYLFILCLFFAFNLDAEETSHRKTICLNMIVKDETPVIERCLATVKPIIDYWVIVDTGSTDGTQEKIKNFMKDIPGELHQKPWVHFAHNRNEALAFAKGKADYVLLMDADDTLRIDPDFKMPDLHADCYNSLILFSNLQFDRPLLIKDALDWKWYGVLHEYLAATQHKTSERLQGLKKIVNTDGNRSKDPQKYQKDAKLLETALEEDPTNSRYVFYLAQSYKDAGNYESSLEQYKKRAEMGGWDEEVFYSKLQVARLQQMLNMNPEIFVKSYYDAYLYRPSRAEPLYHLTRYYRSIQDYMKAYLLASVGVNIPMSQDSLFVDKTIHDYGMQLELSICAYWIGKYEECQAMSSLLLKKPDLPKNVRETIERNISFANAKLVESLQASVE